MISFREPWSLCTSKKDERSQKSQCFKQSEKSEADGELTIRKWRAGEIPSWGLLQPPSSPKSPERGKPGGYSQPCLESFLLVSLCPQDTNWSLHWGHSKQHLPHCLIFRSVPLCSVELGLVPHPFSLMHSVSLGTLRILYRWTESISLWGTRYSLSPQPGAMQARTPNILALRRMDIVSMCKQWAFLSFLQPYHFKYL